MLVEDVAPAANQPESRAVGQPLMTLATPQKRSNGYFCLAGTVQLAAQPNYVAENRIPLAIALVLQLGLAWLQASLYASAKQRVHARRRMADSNPPDPH
eukprot:1143121-Pelagomonas_calceolata.AAC.1